MGDPGQTEEYREQDGSGPIGTIIILGILIREIYQAC